MAFFLSRNLLNGFRNFELETYLRFRLTADGWWFCTFENKFTKIKTKNLAKADDVTSLRCSWMITTYETFYSFLAKSIFSLARRADRSRWDNHFTDHAIDRSMSSLWLILFSCLSQKKSNFRMPNFFSHFGSSIDCKKIDKFSHLSNLKIIIRVLYIRRLVTFYSGILLTLTIFLRKARHTN